MLFLFSHQDGPLRQGAAFMQTKMNIRHPGESAFYLTEQADPKHDCIGGLGPQSTFEDVDCRLAGGESVIIIAHGGNDNQLYDEAQANVTDAALRLMAKIAADNPNGGYSFFLAACGGAIRQPGEETSLLSTLIRGTPAMAEQLLNRRISCWGYTASAGLVGLDPGVPGNRKGRHIYGTLVSRAGVEEHCGYDCRITTQLNRLPDGRYITIYFSPALYPLVDVVAWVNGGCVPDMEERFPNLFATLERTSSA